MKIFTIRLESSHFTADDDEECTDYDGIVNTEDCGLGDLIHAALSVCLHRRFPISSQMPDEKRRTHVNGAALLGHLHVGE